ncbi:MAG TPA: sulfur oxidation c-type cytochrome SoxA [Pseudolabrys sp.]|nr:sulfur oxidation c-type cytochrome SoxA [Pseudolabrys sp.]
MTLVVFLVLGFISTAPLSATEIPLDQRKSGTEFMGPDSRAMQADDTSNPGMLTVLDGEALWSDKTGVEKSCADCHGDAKTSMKGVAARYPAFSKRREAAVDLEARINGCRVGRQKAAAFAPESKALLALTTYIAHQSRGMPIADLSSDEHMRPVIEQGRKLFSERQGQINMSCAQCHDDNWGKSLAGNPVPQAHPTGYPIYRLEWQSMGSLQRRLRNCMIGMRAESFPYGSPDYIALEAFLMWRARGMPMETPAVRP